MCTCSRNAESDRTDESANLFAWQSPPKTPLDHGGPIDRPFTPMGDRFAEESVIAHLDKVVARYPNKLAISDGDVDLTYAELRTAVAALAQCIAAVVPKEAAVGLLLGNSAWNPVAMLASFACGRPCIQLNPRDPVLRTAGIIEEARMPAVVAINPTASTIHAEFADLVWIDPRRARETPQPVAWPTVGEAGSVDAPAVILYTSGSTGRPKGIVNSQRSLLQRVQQYVDACHINADDVLMPLSGATTIAGCREIMTALLTGATLRLIDVEDAGLRRVRRQLEDLRVTVIYIVPALLRALATLGDATEVTSLRMIRIGGEKVLWTDVDLIRSALSRNCLIQVGYSSTETTGTQWFVPAAGDREHLSPPIGCVLPGIDYAIVDDDGQPLPPGEAGELLVRSMFVALGSWEGGRIVRNEADPSDPRKRIFATGDLVKIDADGVLRIVGRKGRQLKINGKRIEPAELEVALRGAPGVTDAVAIASDANELVAFAVAGADADETFIPALRETVRQSLPSVLHPTRLHRLDRIPLLPGGKVDYTLLRDLDRAMRAVVPGSGPVALANATELGKIVEQTWQSILGKSSESGRWDEAGGDSLKLLRCVMELENSIGRELSMEAFTVDMTAAEMIAAIATAPERVTSEVVRSRALPPVFLLPGSIGHGPSLARFGADISDVAHVITVRYPELVGTDNCDDAFTAVTEAALRQIALAQPEGDIRLLGYSLGGGVAFEVASRLIAMGRTVRFVGLLDVSIEGVKEHVGDIFSRTVQRIGGRRVTLHRMGCRAVAKCAVSFGWQNWFGAFISRDWHGRLAATQFLLRLEMEEVLRMHAFHRWIGMPKRKLPIAGTLFRSTQRMTSHDLGWRPLFDYLEIIPIFGGHLDLFLEPHLSKNRPVIAQALARSIHGFQESEIQAAE